MNSLKKNFGKRIREIRKSFNLTQEMFAEKIGMDPPNLSNIESGKKFVSAKTLEKITNALKTTEKDLFDFDHLKNREKLIEAINKFLEISKDEDIVYYYRIIKLHREAKE